MSMSNRSRLARYRPDDVAAIVEMLTLGWPVSVVGLSNFGKSTVLRQMATPAVAAYYHELTGQGGLFAYIDCNRMLQMSAQGFYETVLRAILETLHAPAYDCAALCQRLQQYYERVVSAANAFAIPLAFNDAIITLLEDPTTPENVILLLDEFDDVLTGLDERVFLNLRALKDRYAHLNYVTATLRPLSSTAGGDDLAEFLEIFAAQKYFLQPLGDNDATELAAEIFTQNNDSLDPPERDYILTQAGGHPGLIQAVAHVVLQVESGAPSAYTQQALLMATDVLQNHRMVRSELGKLWKQLLPAERDAVIVAATRGPAALSAMQREELLARGLLVERDGLHLFSELFAQYARRQKMVAQEVPSGVWVDIDAGTVWVGGQRVESLTDLEYRLLLLLYGRMDKICDKYQIVEAVWGQEYLGEVDDARIEKLISRLRSKLEPDPSQPQYLLTVRGRGYRLVQADGVSQE